ncbi:uncharacterized protein LOC144096746 [Amblyomma americanum]
MHLIIHLQQEPLSQQPGDGTTVAATAQYGTQQALTQSHTSPASPLQQAPMDVAESQETLAGPSQQAPMDVTESQETFPGPSQQELTTLTTAPASVATPRRRRPAMVNGPVKCAYF